MRKMLFWLREQILHVLPVVIFFFVIFTLVHYTERLMIGSPVVHDDMLSVAFSALIIGKIVAISNHLPWITMFSEKPLIFATLWKTSIYMACTVVVRVIEWSIKLFFTQEVVGKEVMTTLFDRLLCTPFLVAHMWLALFFLIFVAYQELVLAVGTQRVWQLFFGKWLL